MLLSKPSVYTKSMLFFLSFCLLHEGQYGNFDLSSYFETPYSLPKLDMIAIPDFAAGAMDNYGLVTYRETALLYDDKNSAAANKQRVSKLSVTIQSLS